MLIPESGAIVPGKADYRAAGTESQGREIFGVFGTCRKPRRHEAGSSPSFDARISTVIGL